MVQYDLSISHPLYLSEIVSLLTVLQFVTFQILPPSRCSPTMNLDAPRRVFHCM